MDMFLKSCFAILTIVSLISCSGGTSVATKPKSLSQFPAASGGVDSSILTAEALAGQRTELLYLKSLNKNYCVRLTKLKSECALSAPVLDADADVLTSCSADAASTSIQNKFELSFKAISPIKISLNDGVYVSDTLGAENTDFSGEVKFKELVPGTSKGPRIGDIFNLKLLNTVSRPNNPFGVADVEKFELKANGKVIVTKLDLINKDGGVFLNVDNFKKILTTPACAISNKDLQEIQDSSQQEAKKTEADVLASIEKDFAEPQKLLAELNRERTRSQNFEYLATGQVNRGCWASQKVSTLEVQIVGSKVGDKSLGNDDKGKKPTGAPKSYTFALSDSVKLGHADEGSKSVFKPDGKLTSANFSNSTVAELQFLKITKNGVGYRFTKGARKCGFLGTSTCGEYENYETDRTNISGIKVLVNGEILYERSGISHTFENNALSFIEDKFTQNRAYLNLMARSDCPK
jgi:hypothetical protein